MNYDKLKADLYRGVIDLVDKKISEAQNEDKNFSKITGISGELILKKIEPKTTGITAEQNEIKEHLRLLECMTMRDYFAGQALAGLSSITALWGTDVLAQKCYEKADAMLKERNGGAK